MIEIALVIIVLGKILYWSYKIFRKKEFHPDQELFKDVTNRLLEMKKSKNNSKKELLNNHN